MSVSSTNNNNNVNTPIQNQPNKTAQELVQAWYDSNPNGADMADAFKDISEFLTKPDSTTLDLSGYKITSLPDIFSKEEVTKKLVVFDITKTKITKLPENFNPSELKGFDASGSSISELPKVFNPPKLEECDISSTDIADLPDNFNPIFLKIFKLDETNISKFPNAFTGNSIELLCISDTKITEFPNGFRSQFLRDLYIDNTPKIPEMPFSFPNLETLGIENTEITSLPDTLFNLPSKCDITIWNSRCSDEVLNQISARTSAENYSGPKFIDMGSYDPNDEIDQPDTLKPKENQQLTTENKV